MLRDYASNPIILRDLKKIYPGQDGQPPKVGGWGVALAPQAGVEP